MAKIIKATIGYSEMPAGFPILISDQMAIIEPAFAYLLELATIPGRSHAIETVRTYGEHLHDWFDSLEQSGLDWRTVSEVDIAAYRNRMLSQPSPHTMRPYARSTINDRVRTICRFYAWAHDRGWIEELPFHFVDVRTATGRRQAFLAHLDTRPGMTMANILTVAEHERLPRPLRVDQLRQLFVRLDMPYRLMAEWALATGLRRKELCGLAVFQVPETAHLNDEEYPVVGVPLTITKGDRPRTVYPPIGWWIAHIIISTRRGGRRFVPSVVNGRVIAHQPRSSSIARGKRLQMHGCRRLLPAHSGPQVCRVRCIGCGIPSQ